MSNEPKRTPRIQNIASFLVVLGIVVAFFYIAISPKPASVTVLGEDFSNLHAFESLKEKYKHEHGIEVAFIGHTFDTFDQKANQDLASGTGLYDVILHYSSVLHNYAGKQWVLTVEELKKTAPEADYSFEADLFPEVWRDSSWYPVNGIGTEPIPIGYPFAANTMVLVYNRALFDNEDNKATYRDKFGTDLIPPKDWESFRQVCEFFTRPNEEIAGVVMQGASGSPLYWEWCNFAFGMGGGVMDKDYGWQSTAKTPLILDSPETIKATRFYASLKPFNYGDYFSTGQAEQQEHMRTKKIAMAIMWSDSLFAVINGPNGDNLGFAPIPGNKSMIGGGTFYINRKASNRVEACRYVVRMMQRETQIDLMKRGLCSGLRSVYDDPEVKNLPYADAVQKSLARGVYMLESGPDSGLIVETLESTIQQIWRGEVTIEDGLAAAQKKIATQRAKFFE